MNNGELIIDKGNFQIHKRKSIRLKGYDYSQEGLYFITIVTQNREHIFGEIKNGKMILNQFGEIAQEEWIKSIEIRKNISLLEYIIMPNHMHGIIQINYSVKGVLQYAPTAISPTAIIPTGISPTEKSSTGISPNGKFQSEKSHSKNKLKSPSQTIGAIIRGYKGATTKRIKEIIYQEIDNKKYKNIDLKKSIWQRNYWENIIRNDRAYQNISRYIINNPKKWEEDKFHKK